MSWKKSSASFFTSGVCFVSGALWLLPPHNYMAAWFAALAAGAFLSLGFAEKRLRE